MWFILIFFSYSDSGPLCDVLFSFWKLCFNLGVLQVHNDVTWALARSFHSGTFSWINSLMTSSPWFFGSVFLELLLDFGSLRLISSFCIFTLLFSILVAFYFSFWKSSSTLSSNPCIELFGSAIKMCVFLAFFFVLWMFFFSLLLVIHLLYDEQCRNWKI